MGRQVALIRGDGTGPELVDAMIRVLKASKADVDLVPCDAGLEWWEKHGGDSFIPPETWEILEKSAACFKGPTTTIPKPETPKSVAVSIRQKFNLFANVRPIKTFPNTSGPLGDVDFICVREATEGLYIGIEFRFDDVAIAIRKISRRASGRVTRYAFDLAREKGWKKVVVITKGNILKETDGLFREVVEDVAKDFPEITVDDYFIDNFAQQLVKNPQRFNQNVILSTNLFMDIISEEASGLIGSIGCVYSANIGENYAMFEPAHGSAPKYKGMNKVNPTATILSGAWMLDYVGEKRASKAIFEATNDVIAEGKVVTYDLGGKAKLSEMAEAIAQKTEEILG
ncbi:MAG: isocitrate/isopropylmalate dehydrogenase family protein [archaeon]|nr:isocitrate/isopropylmalate dehydrogenase family protein [archaeon]MCP8306299.1 isocitrate/isopropylmalate dehydrogenase family protein [archaeon]